jgi:hypothetical protein
MDCRREGINSRNAPVLDGEESGTDLPEGIRLTEASGSEQRDGQEDKPSHQPRHSSGPGSAAAVANLGATVHQCAAPLTHDVHRTQRSRRWCEFVFLPSLALAMVDHGSREFTNWIAGGA